MAAVKPPHSAQALFPRTFSPVPDSPWPNSAMTPSTNAAHPNMYVKRAPVHGPVYATQNLTWNRFPPTKSNLAVSHVADEATTPSDLTAPSPSTSETSTVFTDVDGDEEPSSAQPDEEKATELEPSSATSTKSAASNLKVYTTTLPLPWNSAS